MTGLTVEPPKSSKGDRVFKGAIGLLVLVLAYTMVEPYIGGGGTSSLQLRLEADFATISEALKAYESKRGPYVTHGLDALEGDFLDSVPKDPWDNPYAVDPFFRRIVSSGPNGERETIVLGTIAFELEEGAVSDDRIAFYRPQGRLWVTRKEGDTRSVLRMSIDGLTTEPFRVDLGDDVRDASLSPDEQLVAVSMRPEGGSYSIVLCNPDGEDGEVVVEEGNSILPCWSADGGTVLYQSTRQMTGRGKHQQVFAYNVALRTDRPVPGRDDSDYVMPASHPREPTLFTAVEITTGRIPKIVLMSSSRGDKPKALTSSGKRERSPVWSHDGQSVLYVAEAGHGTEVFKQDIDSREATCLTDRPGRKLDVAPSPYDDRFALVFKEDEVYRILISDPETDLAVVVYESEAALSSLRWTK